MSKIGRNDPCLCGSGKKYKKCCGNQKVVGIEGLIEQEIPELQGEFIEYVLVEFNTELSKYTAEHFGHLDMPKEAWRDFSLHAAIWTSFNVPLSQGETVYEKFKRTHGPRVKRPQVHEHLSNWENGRPLIGKIEEVQGNVVTVTDSLKNERVEVKKLDKEMGSPGVGEVLIGYVVPHGESYTFFLNFLTKSEEEAAAFIKVARKWCQEENVTPEEFSQRHFLTLVHLFMGDIEAQTGDGEWHFEWENERYKKVADMVQKSLSDSGYPESVRNIAVMLWRKYCSKKNPKIQKSVIYAASMEYITLNVVDPLTGATQKGVAEKYGVSSKSISNRYREIHDTIEENIFEIMEDLDSEESHLGGIEEFMSNSEGILDEVMDEWDLEELLFSASEAEGEEREELIQEALQMADRPSFVYSYLANLLELADQGTPYRKKAVEAYEKELGGQEFKTDNMGDFWLINETRPYMKAKYKYAEELMDDGETSAAIAELEEMLELNPNDNQGVRYILLVLLAQIGLFDRAERLIETYGEYETLNVVLVKAFIEYKRNGNTRNFKDLLKEVHQLNPYVLQYLKKEKTLPEREPRGFSPGDENEAVLVVGEQGHLWWEEDGLIEKL
ncbi:SEC-C metal-binding domain-containing protein [Pontibacillus salipaludis]|uniref:SEC-C metal-binding domain-containing protein n=1 Tax=Pontibacillus salipaludis TaxID=1697394 RepID=UPI0031E8D145